ncbi:MAG: hypothetical protein K6G01_02240 [Eubacterium sp.]|nr:hypothetical protein [Eubacterium sp.]
MRKEIKEAILAKKEAAGRIVQTILSNPDISYEEFDHLFTLYLCEKFMLVEQELITDNFYEICQLSAEKASHLPKGMLDASELASKCGGATTAMNKKVLFLLAVNREYRVDIQAPESVRVETFTQLKRLVYRKLQEKKL